MPRSRNTSRATVTWAVIALFLAGLPTLAMADDDGKKPDFNKLRREVRIAYGQANYKKSLELAEKMHEVRPDDVDTLYNLACFHCLLGDKDKSYTWLDKAIEAGYSDADYLLNDYDFKTMRAEDRFRKLIKRMRANLSDGEPKAPAKPKKVEKPKKPDKPAKVDKPKKPAKPEKPAKPKKPDAPKLSPQEHGQKIGQLTQELVDMAGKGKHKKALKLALDALSHAEALHKAVGEKADSALSHTHYNVACMYSIMKKKDKAFKHLDLAIKTGGANPDLGELIRNDADFDNIRKDARFAKALAKVGKAGGDEDDADDDEDDDADEDEGDNDKPDLSPADHSRAINDLTNELVAASKKGQRAKALKLALKAVEHANRLHDAVGEKARPSLSLTHYNAACMYSLMKKKDDAFNHLDKAIQAGGWGMDLGEVIKEDADFDNIRKDKRFAKALAKAGADDDDEADDEADADDEDEDEASDDSDADDMSPEAHGRKIGELTQKLLQTSGKGQRKESLKISLEALSHAEALHEAIGDRANPALSLTHYNVACMFSLMKNKDEAFDHLDEAIKAGGFGGNLVGQIEDDTDFDNIRKDPRYAKAVAKAKKSRPSAQQDSNPGEKRVDFEWKITLPDDFDASKPAPLIVALHHYNGTMDRTAARWKKAADKVGAILLTPQGTVKLEEGDYHWGQNLDTIEENVMDAINSAMDRHKVDEDKIILAGFSQGGGATWGLMLRNPDTFRGIIPVAGMFKIESEAQMEEDEIKGLRVFIMVGADENPRVLKSNRKAAKQLKKLGAEVTLRTYKGVGHDFPKNDTEEMIKAIEFILED